MTTNSITRKTNNSVELSFKNWIIASLFKVVYYDNSMSEKDSFIYSIYFNHVYIFNYMLVFWLTSVASQ